MAAHLKHMKSLQFKQKNFRQQLLISSAEKPMTDIWKGRGFLQAAHM
jgi:hypothetical protein